MSDQFPYSFGKYRVEAEIGSGGFGTVFRAVDVDLDRPVAIKILDPLYLRDTRWVARFRREARLMARLDHPNIVPILEIGEEDGRLYLAMKFINGPDLSALINQNGPLPWDFVLEITSQIASALDYAHQQNVIHRDLKPGNILVNNDKAILTDFGLAQMMESNSQSISMTGGIAGTYNYMPPEVFNNEDATPAADIYALGCVVYEMLTGKMLFDGKTTAAIIGAHLKGISLDEPLPDDTPPGAKDVIQGCLAKDPLKRYSTATDFVLELQRISTDLLTIPYAQLIQTLEANNWAGALALAAEIKAQDPNYRDIVALEELAQREHWSAQWKNEAEQAIAKDDFDAARGALSQWRRVDPDNPEIQKVEQSLALKEAVVEEDPGQAATAAALGAAAAMSASSPAAETSPEPADILHDATIIDQGPPVDEPPVDEPPAKAGVPGWLWWAGGAVLLLLLIFGIRMMFTGDDPETEPGEGDGEAIVDIMPTTTPTETAVPPTPTIEPTATNLPTAAPTSTPSPTATPDPNIPPMDPELGTEWQRPQDAMQMVYVPAGNFEMGSSDGNIDEAPMHFILLEEFWLDKTEVTYSQYADFLNELGNQEENGEAWYSIGRSDIQIEELDGTFVVQPEFTDYPVTDVSWEGAAAYCGWASGQLPTEAQWEYAARGSESLIFPWGQEFDGSKGNYCDQNCSFDWKDTAFDDGHAQLAPVGSFADGASWVGGLDMSGNVWEWVFDWYDESYYLNSQQDNPQGPESGENKVLRGGSWGGVFENLRAADRSIIGPNGWPGSVGFRCARQPAQLDIPPAEVPSTTPIEPTEPPPEDPILGSLWQRDADKMTMVYVPAGTFIMGSEDGNDSEKPQHEVAVDGFWIDQTEVTNDQFALFVDEIGYETTAEKEGNGWIVVGSEWIETDSANWQHPLGPNSDLTNLEDHPVTLISWTDALTYCAWSGAMLPSEAQWEFAAKGPESLVYPWGSEFDGQKNNYCDQNCPMDWTDDSFDDNFARTAPVGSFADGASWVGALDMVGNLWEWVNDWHGESYYADSPDDNPTGPEDGTEKVLRGGAWVNQQVRMRGSDRNIIEPTFRTSTFGFRCALPSE